MAQEGVVVPAAPGSLSGAVTNGQGQPLAGISVLLYPSANPSGIRSTTTAANGSYRFSSLPPGDYQVEFRDPAGQYGFQFYGQTALYSESPVVSVIGNDVTGIDATLGPAGAIEGMVNTTGGYTFITLTVLPFRPIGDGRWSQLAPVTLDAIRPASYTVTGLAAGDYRLCVAGWQTSQEPYTGDELLLAECYVDRIPDIGSSPFPVPTPTPTPTPTPPLPLSGGGGGIPPVYGLQPPESATGVQVTAGATTSGIDLTLGDISQLSGRVTNAQGAPLAGIRVVAQTSGPPQYFRREVQTDAQGVYRFGYLAAGDYTISFADPALTYAPEYYVDQIAPHLAELLVIDGESRRADVNASLARAATMVGTLRLRGGDAPQNFNLELIQMVGGMEQWRMGYSYAGGTSSSPELSYTPATGAYQLRGLPPGRYRVAAYASADGIYPLIGYYGGVNSPAEVALSAGGTASNINILLGESEFEGRIEGVVRANGAPQSQIEVGLFSSNWPLSPPPAPIVTTRTDAQGRYRLEGLISGGYRVGFRDPAGLLATTYYTQQVALWNATHLMISGATVYTDINVEMGVGGGIQGQVRRVGGEALSNYQVLVYAFQLPSPAPVTATVTPAQVGPNPWRLMGFVEARTDAAGRYEVKGLPAGSYRVGFAAPGVVAPAELYADDPVYCSPNVPNVPLHFYPQGGNICTASIVTVQPGETTTGIDWVLDRKPTYIPQVSHLATTARWFGPVGAISSMALSPDGSRIALAMSVENFNQEIFVMQNDGNQLTRLTQDPGYDHLPSWSPDGQKLVYVRIPQNAYTHTIHVMDANGGNQTLLTDQGTNPRWSPTGRQISFERINHDTGITDVHIMDADGRNMRNLTNSPGRDENAAWSPDGAKLVFQRHDPQIGGADLYVIHVDGSRLTRLTDNAGIEHDPRWSPDGTRIVFVRYSHENNLQRLYVMNADGGNEVRLTNREDLQGEVSPSWSPDGSQIAFANDRYPIIVNTVEATGGSQPFAFSTLPAGMSYYNWPAWSPDGERIYFLTSTTSGASQVAVVTVLDPPGSR
jgi:Tol biopolymer transport system component